MKKKKRLKPLAKISLIAILLVAGTIGITSLVNSKTINVSKMDDNFTYVNDYIFDNYYPVVKTEEKIMKPYSSDNVQIYKNFYEKESSAEEQEKSIIYHEGIYMQNSGVTYNSEEKFDVLASLSGTVTNITDDALLGKTIEVTTSNKIVMLYQSLSDISVHKGDNINQGQIIAKSGTSSLNPEVKNGLHFEIYNDGSVVNPEKYYDKSVEELLNN